MSPESLPARLSPEELEAEAGAVLPDKEVLSVPLLDLNADIDLALALAAPIDLAVAANANVALPIDASVSANVLSALSSAGAAATQGVLLDQHISGEAIAEGHQVSTVDQGDTGAPADGAGAAAAATATTAAAPAAVAAADPAVAADAAQPVTDAATATAAEPTATPTDAAAEPTADAPAPTDAAAADVVPTEVAVDPITIGDPLAADVGSALEGGLLNVDVNVHLDADLAAPIAGAVAANANVAAPIDAAVAANIGTIGSEAVAVANQTAIITQTLEDVTAHATADQDADVDQ